MKKIIFILFMALNSMAFAQLNNKSVVALFKAGKTTNTQLEKLHIAATDKAIVFQKMELAGKEISNIWGDTILEGPYDLLSKPTVDPKDIIALTYKNELIGYYAVVSATAGLTDDCYKLKGDEYKKCLIDHRGTIKEEFLTKPDFTIINEFETLAVFE